MQLVLVGGIFALLEKHDIDIKDDAIHFTALSIQLRKFYFQTAKGSYYTEGKIKQEELEE